MSIGIIVGLVAAGPRFLNGYNVQADGHKMDLVAAGPRFLNGYNGFNT